MTQLDLVRVQPVQLDDACVNAHLPLRKISSSSTLPRRMSSSASSSAVVHDCAALVLGCGVAGNAAALRLANRGVRVTMVAAAENPHDSATFWAQGGIIYKSHDDTPALLASDVHRAGAGVCDDAAVQKLAVEGPTRVEELLLECANVPFQRDDKGELLRTLEASHNRARILYKADHTGRTIATSMVAAVKKHPNIELLNGRSAFELVTNAEGVCTGAMTVSTTGKIEYFRAPFSLLATGGVGDVYENTSNPEGARGEGLALAARAGARLQNLQYVQFHPTTLYIPGERRFLLTEALRGEGAILRDRAGRAFAKDYHPAGELAPRDVVARLILSEMAKQQEPCMFLDISHEDAQWIRDRFPTIYQHCLQRGIDMTTQGMPVVPAQHYHCGGVEVDLDGCTSVPGLYAAGEVSCTGLHGANRLASTSLLEGLVWGSAAADHFMAHANETGAMVAMDETDPFAGLVGTSEASQKELDEILQQTQRVMWEYVGPLRTFKGMAAAVEKLTQLEIQADKCTRRAWSRARRRASATPYVPPRRLPWVHSTALCRSAPTLSSRRPKDSKVSVDWQSRGAEERETTRNRTL
jgi:L-aspartate oxidase